MDAASTRRKLGTSVHITALDGIVNVNSLFTLAVFLGLAWNPTDPNNSLVTNPTCTAGNSVAEDLVSFHVYSFSSFLFSSLVALGLKQAIRIARSSVNHRIEFLDQINRTALRVGMLVSGVGSVCGCGFLMLALVNVVQIKLGTLACGSPHSFAAVVPLVILVPVALLVYIFLGCSGFNRGVDGAGECGKSSPDTEAWKLAPCSSAAQDPQAEVSNKCCVQVKKMGQNPSCLCAVMLSNMAKASGVKPEVAVTIPKRCNIADRPVGYQCGAYTLP